MKKKSRLPGFVLAAAPLVPVLPEFLEWQNAFLAGLEISGLFLAAAFILKLLEPAFPKRFMPFVFVLTAGAGVYAFSLFHRIEAAAALSLCLLAFPVSEPPKEFLADFDILFWRAVCFLGLAFYLGLMQEIFGRDYHLPLFQRLPGTFLLLVLPAIFWPASRKRKGALVQRRHLKTIGLPPETLV